MLFALKNLVPLMRAFFASFDLQPTGFKPDFKDNLKEFVVHVLSNLQKNCCLNLHSSHALLYSTFLHTFVCIVVF